jgi:hypothetical protein
MNDRTFSTATLILRTITIATLACLVSLNAFAQSTPPKPLPAPASTVDEKADKIIQRAIAAMGGSAYLNVRSSTGRGLYTLYREGVSGIPSSFIDYIVYPDKERTEFRQGGSKIIQTNTGETGWLYDGAARTIKDQTPAQVADFKQNMRTTVDSLLRGNWRKEGAKVTYVGRREAGLARRNEAVRVVYPDGFTVDFEFGAQDGMPVKVVYKRTNSEGEEVTEEDRLAQFVNTGGVNSPFIIDHYISNVQSSRINYQSIEFNTTIADTLFARPASVKAVK